MAKTKISEYSATASSNTDINSINLAEGMAPSLVNNAIRQLMAQLKDFQAGTAGDNVTVGGNLAVTGTSAFTGAISAPMTAGTIDGVPIGGTTPAAGAFTTLAASGTTTLAGALVGAVTQAAFNTVSTTLNLGGAATAVNIGAATGTATVNNTTLAAKAITASTTLAVTGASTLTGAVTASSILAVTGAATLSSTLAVTGTSTLTGAVTATAGVTGPLTSSNATITGGTITGITDLAVADGGTGASTAANARTNLSAAASGANSDITSITGLTTALTVLQGGTGVTTSTGSGNVVLSTSPTLVTPLLGTPTSGVATNLTGLPISTGVSGLGTGIATLLATPSSANLASAITDETGSGSLVFATSPTLVTPALGTPTSGTLTNATGLPISTGVSGLGSGVATFLATPSSANLISAVTDETGTGSLVFATSPTLVTPALGTPSALVGTNITGTASGLTAGNVTTNANLTGAVTSVGNATSLGSFTSSQLLSALTDETGTGANVFATSPTLVTPILGTPTSATLTNATGLPLTTGVTGQLPVANGGTGTATPSIVAGTNVTVTGTWPNQTIASSGSGGGVSYTAVKTANYTAANNDGVLTNTTGGAFTVTLPTSPSVGNIVLVIDSLSQWGTNNLTVDPTALIKIAGNTAGDTLICDITGATVTLVYTGATYGWNVAAQVGGNGGTAVTLTGTQTLTNKTLTSPIISSISNAGTLTLPTSTDTLVGRATTDTLTNKTLTSPTLTTPVLGTPASGTVTNLTGTASININGTVGATTPAAGNFTTFGATGVATFSAGTAALPALTTSGDTNTGIFFPAADTIAFSDGGTERARITSTGSFLIGNTTGTQIISIGSSGLAYGNQGSAVTSGNTGTWTAQNSTAGSISLASDYISSEGTGVLQTDSGTLNGIWFRMYGTSGYGYNFRINKDGNATNLNGSYGTISDARVKTVVGQATSQWNDIKQLNLVKYKLNKDTQFEASPENTEGFVAPTLMGLVAQELELICPGLVTESADPELGQIKTIKTSILYMKAVKALQEAMGRIEQLEARITALEGI